MQQKQHFYWLDLIRFLAALAVVLVHARGEAWETYSQLEESSQNIFTFILYAIISQGFTGVIVFFVLSGFLVGGRTSERIINGTANIKQYCIDRSVRIGLPLVGSLALIAIVDAWIGAETNWTTMLGNLFALQGIFVGDVGGVFWTLSYEMWFYVLFAGIIALFSINNTLNIKYIIGGGIITLALSAFTVLDTFYLFILLMGCAAYYMAKHSSQKSNLIILVSSIMFVISLCGLMLSCDSKAFDMSLFKFINKDVMTLLVGFCAALFISDIVKRIPKTHLQKKVDNIGSKLAVFSYSLYLTHWQVLRIINHYWGRSTAINTMSILKLLITILACIIFSYFFYLLTERNTAVVKKWIKNKL